MRQLAVRRARTALIICLRIMGLYDVSVRHSFVRHYGSTVSAEVPLVAKLGRGSAASLQGTCVRLSVVASAADKPT